MDRSWPGRPSKIETQVLEASAPAIARAASLLQAGELVAFPTETVYGLGGDATNATAVARIFAVKGRPSFNPLIVHLGSAEEAERLVELDGRAERLAETFWPGPLTLVLKRRPDCPVALLASAGLDSLAVRVPGHPAARALLRAAGLPVAAPSANRSGRLSPTTPAHVLEELGGLIPLVLAGGRTAVGLESTVLDLTAEPPVLARPGAVTAEEIEEAIGPIAAAAAPSQRPNAPGQLASHYAPRAAVRLEAGSVGPGEALLTFGPDLRRGELVLNLSEAGDLTEAAANLFAMLRALDRPGVAAIAVSPIPETGLGAAINDRLRRAAAPRR